MTVADGPGPPEHGSPRRRRVHPARRQRGEPNRLHRRTDLMEDVLSWLLGVVLAAGVFTAFLTAGATYDGMTEQSRDQAGDRFPVNAVLTEDVPIPIGASGNPRVYGAVRFTPPDGLERTGQAQVSGGQPAGTTVPVWSTRDGVLVPPPMTGADAAGVAVLTGIVVALAWATGCAGLSWSMVRWTEARYARSWEHEWAVVEPEWSGRQGDRPTEEA